MEQFDQLYEKFEKIGKELENIDEAQPDYRLKIQERLKLLMEMSKILEEEEKKLNS